MGLIDLQRRRPTFKGKYECNIHTYSNVIISFGSPGRGLKLKVMIYQTVLKPYVLYCAECWAKRKKEEHMLNKTN